MSCRRVVGSAAVAFLSVVGGCGGDQVSLGNPPIETVTPFDWNPAVALVRAGDTIYAPRVTRLDAIDAQGASRTVAGLGYAECPTEGRHESFRGWNPLVDDPGYPALLVDGNSAIFSNAFCGVWSVSVSDASKRALLEDRIEDDVWQNSWGGQMGPRWQGMYPPAVAPDGDDLVICLTADRLQEEVERWRSGAPPDSSTQARAELWRTARDGSPKKRLAVFDPREPHCTHMLQDGASLFVATDHAIHRLDRSSDTPVTIATDAGGSFGVIDGRGLDGLVQDADHLYLLRRAVIERLSKDGSSRTVLVPSSGMTRLGLATDGKHVYWAEAADLYRVAVTGGAPEQVVDGSEERGVYPMPPVITNDHIFFQMFQKVPPHSVTDPESGTTLDDVKIHYSIARVTR